jgi:hypothetical protein
VVSVQRATLFRIAAILLLLIAGAGVYACDLADACVASPSGQSSDCDQPSGDNCLCCCHHVIPATTIALQTAEYVCAGMPSDLLDHTSSMAVAIEHPPQL